MAHGQGAFGIAGRLSEVVAYFGALFGLPAEDEAAADDGVIADLRR
jgi:hypothetical protein